MESVEETVNPSLWLCENKVEMKRERYWSDWERNEERKVIGQMVKAHEFWVGVLFWMQWRTVSGLYIKVQGNLET